MSAFLGLVIFTLAYEAVRWLAIKAWRAVKGRSLVVQLDKDRIHASASRWAQEKADRHAAMDEGYRTWRAGQVWEQPPPRRCPGCGKWIEPLQDLCANCGQKAAPETDAHCIVCWKLFPGVEKPRQGTLYCHTACFQQWKERG